MFCWAGTNRYAPLRLTRELFSTLIFFFSALIITFSHLRAASVHFSNPATARGKPGTVESCLLHIFFFLLLSLYYSVLSHRGVLHTSSILCICVFGLGCSIWVSDTTFLILPSRRCSRPFSLLCGLLDHLLLFSPFIFTPSIVLLGMGLALYFGNGFWTCIFGSNWLSDTY